MQLHDTTDGSEVSRDALFLNRVQKRSRCSVLYEAETVPSTRMGRSVVVNNGPAVASTAPELHAHPCIG